MGIDINLNEEGDINQNPKLIDGEQQIKQSIRLALNLHRGEYILNESAGIPWLSIFQDRDVEPETIAPEIIRAILSVEGVDRVQNFDIVKNGSVFEVSAEIGIAGTDGTETRELVIEARPLEGNVSIGALI